MASAGHAGNLHAEAAVAFKFGLGLARLAVYQNLQGSRGYGFALFVLNRAENYHIFAFVHCGNFVYGNGRGHNFRKSQHFDPFALVYVGKGIDSVRCNKLRAVANNPKFTGFYIISSHFNGKAHIPTRFNIKFKVIIPVREC